MRDFIISDVNDVIYTIPFNILLDKRIAVDLPLIAVKSTEKDFQLFQKYVNENTQDVMWKFG
jgi:hypothetical protein